VSINVPIDVSSGDVGVKIDSCNVAIDGAYEVITQGRAYVDFVNCVLQIEIASINDTRISKSHINIPTTISENTFSKCIISDTSIYAEVLLTDYNNLSRVSITTLTIVGANNIVKDMLIENPACSLVITGNNNVIDGGEYDSVVVNGNNNVVQNIKACTTIAVDPSATGNRIINNNCDTEIIPVSGNTFLNNIEY
jgi:hypothetical protein